MFFFFIYLSVNTVYSTELMYNNYLSSVTIYRCSFTININSLHRCSSTVIVHIQFKYYTRRLRVIIFG